MTSAQFGSPSVDPLTDKRAWTQRLVFVCGIAAIFGIPSANPLLTFVGFGVVPILFALLWRPGEPPVLLFAATFQWLQAFTPVLTANRTGDVLGATPWTTGIDVAAWLGLIAIVVLAVGMRLGAGRASFARRQLLERASAALDPGRLAKAYLLAVFVGLIGDLSTRLVPGLRQQLLVIGDLRWVVIFLVGWAAVGQRRVRPLAVILFIVEIGAGSIGYFSGFKTILFLALVIIAGSTSTIRKVIRPAMLAVFALALLLMTFWQSIKEDYRAFLSEDVRAQVVTVPIEARFRFLFERALDVSLSDFQSGWQSGIDRLGYLEFFGKSVRTVPARIPHQNGRLWAEAIQHVLMPRILFPNKPAIDDSARTNEFTGERVATAAEGASISIGYAAESYIDFGPIFMFVPILLLGLLWGWAYRWIAGLSRYPLLGLAVATNLILGQAIHFEASNLKLVGGALTYLIVFGFVLRYFDSSLWRSVTVRGARMVAGPAMPQLPNQDSAIKRRYGVAPFV